ncbi:SRPBCC family protein [Seonamhaeicola marinus]|uniref:AraC effector-binding domain-containing protein n=1 Tax=Seonamhaeicola marinus TaxID=1912246 RepID=A0A5D0HHS3_9FLAO|nr:SRPBCC family protein [Seonamhaeicola marinus]TYA69819.1 hypothetical protein FUA24_21225 [Seonamhaeicola marinus]
MPKTFVSRSIVINTPKEKIKDLVSDLHNWRPWSPWLVCEPEAVVNVQEDGKFYTWEGKRVGSGELKVVSESENLINYDLTFLKPWKSHAKVEFKFSEVDGGIKTEWTMHSSLPFFMFWMKKQMEAWIGMDYERGLKMLKEYVETGKINSKLEFVGQHDFEGCDFIGIKRTTLFKDIGEAMESDFTALGEFIATNNIEPSGLLFSQYHKFDLVSGKVIYTAGIPVSSIPANLGAKFISGNLPKTKLNTVRHHGPYDHLGNAWSTAQMMMRNKEFKPVKKYHPLEFYHNDPAETSPEDLITDVSFACK